MKYHVEEGAKRRRAAGCEGRPGQGSVCCPKQDARLAWGLRPVSRWLGGSKKWDTVEEAGFLAFLEDMATWGGNRDPTQVEGQLGRSTGGGSPRESGILAGTWFSRDQLHRIAGESLKFTKELLSSLSRWDSHALLEPGRHGRTQRGASWCHQALGPV